MCPVAMVFTLHSVLPVVAHNVGPANSLSGTDAPAPQLLRADVATAQCQAGHCDKAVALRGGLRSRCTVGMLSRLTPLQGPCQHAGGELVTLGSP